MGRQNDEVVAQIDSFVQAWQADEQSMRACFLTLYQEVERLEGVSLDFTARPGVSYSLRPRHNAQKDRDLFAIIDVIDDEPEARWLSVCFYEDMISDPEERGELIPGGLGGSDGYCFDLYDNDKTSLDYVAARIREAGTAAAL